MQVHTAGELAIAGCSSLRDLQLVCFLLGTGRSLSVAHLYQHQLFSEEREFTKKAVESLQFIANGVGLIEFVNAGDDKFVGVARCNGIVGLLGFRALKHGIDILVINGMEEWLEDDEMKTIKA